MVVSFCGSKLVDVLVDFFDNKLVSGLAEIDFTFFEGLAGTVEAAF